MEAKIKDYTIHKLTADSQLRPCMNKIYSSKAGPQTFWQYAERLYSKIIMMVPGESFIIDDLVEEDNRDMFIKILCAFIAGGVAQGFLFNQYYTEFRRCHQPITQSKENILKNK